MSSQKFQIGDCVRIRHYDQIDLLDIGDLSYSESMCYGIPKRDVEKGVKRGDLIVRNVSMYRGAYVYNLSQVGEEYAIGYQWAQGMLEPAYPETVEIPDADEFLAKLFA